VKLHEAILISEQSLLCEQYLAEVCRTVTSAVARFLEESVNEVKSGDIADVVRIVGDAKNERYRIIVVSKDYVATNVKKIKLCHHIH
jgi:hypothetical protein